MKPKVTVLMMSSVDGRLHSDAWSAPAGDAQGNPAGAFEREHDRMGGDAWMVGRVTMTEFATGAAHPPAKVGTPPRPLHRADPQATRFAIGLDAKGKLHWAEEDFGDEHFIAVLGSGVSDAHLAELAGDGVSYIVVEGAEIDLAAVLEMLHDSFGIRHLLVEGGGVFVGEMLKAGLVDAFTLLVYPGLDGTTGAPSIVETGAAGLKDRLGLVFEGVHAVEGGAVRIDYTVVNR